MTAERYAKDVESLRRKVEAGELTPNEARLLLGLPPVEGGHEPVQPVVERDAR